jgi:two-component sensor histidine kinase
MFLLFPVLVWSALRLGQRSTATAVAVVAGIAIWAAKHGLHAFMGETLNERLLLLQTFMGVLSVTSLALGAVTAEWRLAQAGLADASRLQRLLLSELDHRVRNNLASLAALIDISASGQSDVKSFAVAIRSRVQAMSSVHLLLSQAHGRSVDLVSLLKLLTPSERAAALCLSGPQVGIPARQLTALGMVMQELFMNSLKYGALSTKNGRLFIDWRLTDDDAEQSSDQRLELTWRESGGPPVADDQPKPGIGTGLIDGLVRHELDGTATLTYPPQGALHQFVFRLAANPLTTRPQTTEQPSPVSAAQSPEMAAVVSKPAG